MLFFFSVFPGPVHTGHAGPVAEVAVAGGGSGGGSPGGGTRGERGESRSAGGPRPRPSSHLPADASGLLPRGIHPRPRVAPLEHVLSPEGDVRRKGRLIVGGTLLGLVPALALQVVSLVLRRSPAALGFWVWAPAVIALSLLPLSYAYAVVKHRVLEVPVLLRRSARYLLVQRGAVGLLVGLALFVTLLVAQTVEIPLQDAQSRTSGSGSPSEPASALFSPGGPPGFTAACASASTGPSSGGPTTFIICSRSSPTRIRSAGSRDEMARLLEEQLKCGAPASLPGRVSRRSRWPPARHRHHRAFRTPRRPRRPPRSWLAASAAPTGPSRRVLEAGAFEPFRPHEPECLVPLNGRDGRLIGLS